MVYIQLYNTNLDFDEINYERERISADIKEYIENYNYKKDTKYAVIFDIDGTLLKNDKFVPGYKHKSEFFKDIKKASWI